MQTIFITGASSGIGKSTAKFFQSKGWNVIATMRNPEKETELTKLENIIVLPLDVTNIEQIKSTVTKAISLFQIDVVHIPLKTDRCSVSKRTLFSKTFG